MNTEERTYITEYLTKVLNLRTKAKSEKNTPEANAKLVAEFVDLHEEVVAKFVTDYKTSTGISPWAIEAKLYPLLYKHLGGRANENKDGMEPLY